MSTHSKLSTMADAVETEKDFLEFLRALQADREYEEELLRHRTAPRYKGDPGWVRSDGWENGDIVGFLSGMYRWVIDADHTRKYDDAPDWRLFAYMLLAGRDYE